MLLTSSDKHLLSCLIQTISIIIIKVEVEKIKIFFKFDMKNVFSDKVQISVPIRLRKKANNGKFSFSFDDKNDLLFDQNIVFACLILIQIDLDL